MENTTRGGTLIPHAKYNKLDIMEGFLAKNITQKPASQVHSTFIATSLAMCWQYWL